jgi:hypothetical protein
MRDQCGSERAIEHFVIRLIDGENRRSRFTVGPLAKRRYSRVLKYGSGRVDAASRNRTEIDVGQRLIET